VAASYVRGTRPAFTRGMHPLRNSRRPRESRRGFSIIELMIVFLVFGVVAAIGFPRFSYAREVAAMRSAKTQIATTLATARAAAIRRSGGAEVRATGNSISVVAGTETVVPPILLDSTYHVSLAVAPGVVRYDARGLAVLDSTVKFVFTRATHRDSVCITRLGAVMREGCLR